MAPIFRATLLSLLAALPSVLSETVQYCRTGYNEGQADFCMGVATHRNTSSRAWDVYLALTVTRSSALGWTAVGTGPQMAGALMLVVYGDPTAADDPVLSVRTIDGHHPPQLLDPSAPGTPELRVLHAKWHKLPPPPSRRHEDSPDYPLTPQRPATHVADIAVACYGCGSSAVSSTTNSQPFIWAWNDRQKFPSFAPDARLEMHRHHAGSGGFGNFYVDMTRSVVDNPAAAPPIIQPSVARLGTSDGPIGIGGVLRSLRERPLPRAHGLFMAVAFLFMFPLGVVLMRSASGNPFQLHWRVQMAATGVAWLGATVGVVMTGGRIPSTVHQWVGVGVVLALGIQAVLGWRHHVVFLRVRKRTWISHGHIWLGRTAVLVGWVNVLTGMALSGQGGLSIGLVAALVAVEAAGVGLWVWSARLRAAKQGKAPGQVEGHALMPRGDGAEEYFSLGMSDEEYDTDGEDNSTVVKRERLSKSSMDIGSAAKE